MAVSINKYQKWVKNSLNGAGSIDWDTDTIKVALLSSSHTPSVSTHDFFDDVSADEVSGTGYTAGGATIGSIAVTESAGTATVDGNDVTWTQNGAGFTGARYAVVYKSTGTASTSPLVFLLDLDTNRTNTTGDLTIQWNAAGIFTAV